MRSQRVMRFSVAAVLLVLSVLLVGGASAALIGSTQGFVIYRVAINNQQVSAETFILNETVQPTSESGFVLVTTTALSTVRNFTDSNTVNSTSFPEIFPYLVGLNNQSISYGTNGMIDLVNVRNTGSAQVTFNGQTYEGTSYQVSVSAAFSLQSLEVSGNATVVTLPSGLIYSVQLQSVNGYSANAQLMQTNLPVTVATGSSLPVGLALITIGLVGAVAFAVPSIFIRWRKKPGVAPASSEQPHSEGKPSYWVD